MTLKKDSEVVSYMKRARRHYRKLGINKDAGFFYYLGVAPDIKNNWHNLGIRQVYYSILDLLEKIEELENNKPQ
jgi:hypothetical protein